MRDMGKLLLRNGANPSIKHNAVMQNYSPFWFGILLNESELLSEIISAEPNCMDTVLVDLNIGTPFTPIQYADANGASECAALLRS